MKTLKNQYGFINLDGLDMLFYLAFIGLLAICGGLVYAIYWLIIHFPVAG